MHVFEAFSLMPNLVVNVFFVLPREYVLAPCLSLDARMGILS